MEIKSPIFILSILKCIPRGRDKRRGKKRVKKWLLDAEKVAVIGIGNPIHTDDYVGVKVIHGLRRKISEKVLLIECETIPESYMQQIVDFKPTHIFTI